MRFKGIKRIKVYQTSIANIGIGEYFKLVKTGKLYKIVWRNKYQLFAVNKYGKKYKFYSSMRLVYHYVYYTR
jgi:hypothetical protein